jgi:hypothetical protein
MIFNNNNNNNNNDDYDDDDDDDTFSMSIMVTSFLYTIYIGSLLICEINRK